MRSSEEKPRSLVLPSVPIVSVGYAASSKTDRVYLNEHKICQQQGIITKRIDKVWHTFFGPLPPFSVDARVQIERILLKDARQLHRLIGDGPT